MAVIGSATRRMAAVLVVRASVAPHAEQASLEPGRVEVRLPSGLAISGRVLVDGEIPLEPVRLELTGQSRFPAVAGLAASVRHAPGCSRLFGDTSSAEADAAGRVDLAVEAAETETEDEEGPWRRWREGPEITVVAGEIAEASLDD